MPRSRRPPSSRDKVRAHRARLRDQGLRPVQVWVPDIRSPMFQRSAHEQARAVAASRHEQRDQHFIDQISGLDDG